MDTPHRLDAESLRLLDLIDSLERRIHALESIAKTTGEAVAAAAALLDTLTDAVKRHIDYEQALNDLAAVHRLAAQQRPAPNWRAQVDQAHSLARLPEMVCHCVTCQKARADERERRARRDADA